MVIVSWYSGIPLWVDVGSVGLSVLCRMKHLNFKPLQLQSCKLCKGCSDMILLYNTWTNVTWITMKSAESSIVSLLWLGPLTLDMTGCFQIIAHLIWLKWWSLLYLLFAFRLCFKVSNTWIDSIGRYSVFFFFFFFNIGKKNVFWPKTRRVSC